MAKKETQHPADKFLSNKRIAFFGVFSYWPWYHGGGPETVAERHGATLTSIVNDELDIVVFAEKRGPGRSQAKLKVAAIQRKEQAKNVALNDGLQVLDEVMYRELVRRDVTGCKFHFCGTFDCCPPEMDHLLLQMVEHAGGVVGNKVDETLDYLVEGNKRGKGKTAALREGKELTSNGSKLRIISESSFLELVRVEGGANSSATDEITFAGFVSNLHGIADEKKLQKALKMLQKESMELYSNVTDSHVSGVVRSQTNAESIYAPWIDVKGTYGCTTSDLSDCMGLQGKICKHLLVLIMGLVQAGNLDPKRTLEWLSSAGSRRPAKEGEYAVEAFLQYKGVIAGEIDWRPTETVPEDFFAL